MDKNENKKTSAGEQKQEKTSKQVRDAGEQEMRAGGRPPHVNSFAARQDIDEEKARRALVGIQLDRHTALNRKLQANNLPIQPSFWQANKLAFNKGLITKKEYAENELVNKTGNNAKHFTNS